MSKRKNILGLSILTLGAVAFLACSYDGRRADLNINSSVKDTTFLINLDGTSLSLGSDGVKKSQDQFFNELHFYLGNDYTLVRTFDEINAVQIKANSKYESTLNLISNVSKVSIDQKYRFGGVSNNVSRTASEIEEGYIPYEASGGVSKSADSLTENQSAKSMMVPETNNGGKGSFIAILDTGYLMDHEYFEDLTYEESELRFTYDDLVSLSSSNRLIARQRDGASKGEEGSLYYNKKIPFYFDYGASSTNSANDYDVVTTLSEHGTHVASIAGANGTYDGIAPNAQLALMKVFYENFPTNDTSVGSTYAQDSDILEALNDCVALGVDSLNMSLGSDLDDFDNRSAAMNVIDELSNDGVICSISAGNAGKNLYSSMGGYKYWTTDQVDTGVLGSYGNSATADIIASSTTEQLFYETGLRLGNNVIGYDDQVDYTDGSDGITERNEHLLYEDTQNIENLEMVIIRSNDGESTTGASADYDAVRLAAEGGADYFNNKIAVVDRGGTSFVDKATAAENAGCAGLIVINNDPTAYEFNFGMSWTSGESYDIPEIPVVFVLNRDRNTILDYCRENSVDSPVLSAPLSVIQDEVADNPNAFEMSDFSSDGAKYDLTLNPSISAPGSSIQGATIGEANSQGIVEELDRTSVGYLSGTSMAAPNYTGAVALMVGEQNFENDEARRDYLRSLSARVMSTGQIYDIDLTNYGTINSEKGINNNSTPNDDSDDYEVDIYVPEESEVVNETVTYSPRKQGAGVVNVTNALSSKVYLEGLEVNSKGTYSSNPNGFGKIELRNNDLVKNGTLNFKVRAHNETTSSIRYNVKFSLMTPQLTSYHTNEDEEPNYVGNEAQFEGAKVSSSYDSYQIMNLDKWNSSLTDENMTKTIDLEPVEIPAGTNDIDLGSYTLSDEQKKFINDNFENGTYLEGYIYLVPVSDSGTEINDGSIVSLNIPYMGFFNDYGKAEAVEPFDFEREVTYNRTTGVTENAKLHGSDFVNYLGRYSYGRTNTNVGSMISALSFENYQNNNTAKGSMLQNNNNLYDYGQQLNYVKDEDGNITLYAGGEGSDVLYIQQYVYRSMNSGKISIIDATNKVVKEKSLTSMINGGTNLYKSHINTSYISSYILSDRAYAELPLYLDNGSKIPNGTYTLRFDYSLVYGSTQRKDYTLVIDTNAPELVSKSVVTINGSSYIRLKFNELYIPQNSQGRTYVYVNAGLLTDYILTHVSDGYILDIPYNENTFNNGKLLVSIQDSSRTYARIMLNEAPISTGLFIESDLLTVGYNYSYTRANNSTGINSNINETYTVSATDYTGASTNLGSYTAYITFDKKVSSGVRVYGIGSNQNEVLISDVSLLDDGQTLRIRTSFTQFRVEDNGIYNPPILGGESAGVSVLSSENGQVFVDKTSGVSGDRVTVYAIANEGYRVESVKVNGNEINKDQYGNYSFTLVAGENRVEVSFVKA